MKIIDISRGIFSSELYPSTLPPCLERTAEISRGDAYNCSTLTLDLHTATHVDAESHFFDDGLTVDLMPLERYVGRARVFDCSRNTIEALPDADDAQIVLLRNATYLSTDDCRLIIAKGYHTIGTDRLSPAAPDNEEAVHRLLLGGGVGLVEMLDLTNVDEGLYLFVALPLRIESAEASPVRAVLITQ